MSDIDLKDVHEDLVALRRDISVIKHILSEEGDLTDEAKKRLAEARATPDSEYIGLD